MTYTQELVSLERELADLEAHWYSKSPAWRKSRFAQPYREEMRFLELEISRVKFNIKYPPIESEPLETIINRSRLQTLN